MLKRIFSIAESKDPRRYQMSLMYNFPKLSSKYASSLATITILLLTSAVLATLLLTAPSKDAEIKARFPLTSDGFRWPVDTQQKGRLYTAHTHNILLFISPQFYGWKLQTANPRDSSLSFIHLWGSREHLPKTVHVTLRTKGTWSKMTRSDGQKLVLRTQTNNTVWHKFFLVLQHFRRQ